MDIQWMVITESLGVGEANRWRQARIGQMLDESSTAEGPIPNPVTHGSGIGVWLMRALAGLVGCRPRRSALQAAPQV
jgi:hypothetical protein